jgi:hypothetical protein
MQSNESNMSDKVLDQQCQCGCGKTRLTIQDGPLVRIFCHCTICQEFNMAAYADVSIFLAKDVNLHNRERVNFKQYKSPPAVQRGKCASCDQPIIEFLELPLLPSLAIIPSEHLPMGSFLAEPSSHIFYQSRVADIHDELPKHNGFITSQMTLSAKLIAGMVRKFVTALRSK